MKKKKLKKKKLNLTRVSLRELGAKASGGLSIWNCTWGTNFCPTVAQCQTIHQGGGCAPTLHDCPTVSATC